ncbi:hypothetical protein HGRIS_004456 [Hohenbuehelia grisea]|uniref:DUF7918 domain-containing protein n=1 Tax=Hohenbuehelia grisea TaxID=104357 RepID=A0ABR3JD54_9AGAR
MPTIGNFSAWITVDGESAIEYDVAQEGHNTVTCWIPSKVGKEFVVHWKDSARLITTSGQVKIDGKGMGGKIMRQDLSPFARPVTANMAGFAKSTTEELPFIFSNTELTDDDSYLHDSGVAELGLIELSLCRATVTKPLIAPSYSVPSAVGKVHERMKKGGAHSVQLGKSKPVKCSFVQTQVLDSTPVAKFVFKYRPLDILQAQDIAPLSASAKRKATPEENDDNEDGEEGEDEDEDVKPDLAEDGSEDDAEAAELKALEERVNTLREKRANKANSAKRVKREHPPAGSSDEVIDLTSTTRRRVKQENRPVFLPGEVIDLT